MLNLLDMSAGPCFDCLCLSFSFFLGLFLHQFSLLQSNGPMIVWPHDYLARKIKIVFLIVTLNSNLFMSSKWRIKDSYLLRV